eukprot:COSAG04_NODE_69_length_29236_cov_15.813680_6_plen_198_part_00
MRNLSLTEDTRPTELLRLVAGGDDEAVLTHVCNMPAAQRARVEVACEVRPGDVIAYATPLFHSSFNGGAFRPVFQTTFWAESPTHELRVARRKEARTIRREPPRYRCHLGCILLKMPAVSLLTGNHYNMFNFPDSTHYPYCPADWAAAGAKDSPRREWARQMAEVAWVEERGIASEEEAEALAEQERAAGRGPRPRL